MVTKFELRIPKVGEISKEDLEQSAREIQEFEHNEIDNYDLGAMPDDYCDPGAMPDEDELIDASELKIAKIYGNASELIDPSELEIDEIYENDDDYEDDDDDDYEDDDDDDEDDEDDDESDGSEFLDSEGRLTLPPNSLETILDANF